MLACTAAACFASTIIKSRYTPSHFTHLEEPQQHLQAIPHTACRPGLPLARAHQLPLRQRHNISPTLLLLLLLQCVDPAVQHFAQAAVLQLLCMAEGTQAFDNLERLQQQPQQR
jgi:hypothetical protein